jgi:hypothetical protein
MKVFSKKREILILVMTLVFILLFGMICSVSATIDSPQNGFVDVNLKNKDVLLNSKTDLKIEVKNNGSPASGYFVDSYVYNKKTSKNKLIGKLKTNSNGLANIKHKFTNLGTNKILLKVKDPKNSQILNKKTNLTVYKSFLKVKNSCSVKGYNAYIKSSFLNKGSVKQSFKIYYADYLLTPTSLKISSKSNIKKYKIRYFTNNLCIEVFSLKKNKKVSLLIKFETNSLNIYKIGPKIKTSKNVKVLGNSYITFKGKKYAPLHPTK